MKKTKKNVIAAATYLGGLFLVPALFWLNGFNFDKRGEVAVLCALATLFVPACGAFLVVLFPSDE